MRGNQFDTFIQLLTQLPPEVWNTTVKAGIGWRLLRPLSEVWEFGHFAALYIVLGLNDYQTKGKAEVGYWPKVVPMISKQPDPENPIQLISLLKPFYSSERVAQAKVERLERFSRSNLCREIWVSSSASLAANFEQTWWSLGRTMNQQPAKKTIAFAMKCLALALLMVNETNFDFAAIPVPVDSRIRTVSYRLGLPDDNDATERERWHLVLTQIQKSHPAVTMVHLDSLLWQIGTLEIQEMEAHLRKIGARDCAPRISELFSASDPSGTQKHTCS